MPGEYGRQPRPLAGLAQHAPLVAIASMTFSPSYSCCVPLTSHTESPRNASAAAFHRLRGWAPPRSGAGGKMPLCRGPHSGCPWVIVCGCDRVEFASASGCVCVARRVCVEGGGGEHAACSMHSQSSLPACRMAAHARCCWSSGAAPAWRPFAARTAIAHRCAPLHTP